MSKRVKGIKLYRRLREDYERIGQKVMSMDEKSVLWLAIIDYTVARAMCDKGDRDMLLKLAAEFAATRQLITGDAYDIDEAYERVDNIIGGNSNE